METTKIQTLVFSFMDRVGISRWETSEGVWCAEIPESERAFFNGFEHLHFTFDRGIAERRRELELICSGSFMLRKIVDRLVEIPKVSRLFSSAAPELPSSTGQPGELRVISGCKAHYRQQVLFHFRVSVSAEQRRELLFSALADPAKREISLKEGLSGIDLNEFSEMPDPALPIQESGEDLVRLYLQACRTLESSLEEHIRELQAESEESYQQELAKVQEYLEDQKRELLKKRENVCFHLYFFQKEEEIDRMMRELETEQARKIEELKEKHALKIQVSLINAVVLCIPTLGMPTGQTARRTRDAKIIPMPLPTGSDRCEVRPAV